MLAEEKIRSWVADFIDSKAELDCYLIDIEWDGSKSALSVFVDSDAGLTLGNCQKLSRAMESELDDSMLLGEDYRLEVSSPGIDRPLVLNRQYAKNIDRVLKIQITDGSEVVGKLKEVTEEGIRILVEKPGVKYKKPTYKDQMDIRWEQINQSIVQIRF